VGKAQPEWVCRDSFQSAERPGAVGLEEKSPDVGSAVRGLELVWSKVAWGEGRGKVRFREEEGGSFLVRWTRTCGVTMV